MLKSSCRFRLTSAHSITPPPLTFGWSAIKRISSTSPQDRRLKFNIVIVGNGFIRSAEGINAFPTTKKQRSRSVQLGIIRPKQRLFEVKCVKRPRYASALPWSFSFYTNKNSSVLGARQFCRMKFVFDAKLKNEGILPYFKAFQQASYQISPKNRFLPNRNSLTAVVTQSKRFCNNGCFQSKCNVQGIL